jgi:hypothetical protein
MSVLMFALGIYIVGVAIVLYLRPSIMFRSGGWKEFGLANTGNYTVFPFWMFTVLWAFLSYVLATMATVFFSSLALKSSPNMANNFNIQPISSAPSASLALAPAVTPTVSAPAPLVTPTLSAPAPTPMSAAPVPAPLASAPLARAPGYYILTPSPTQQPQYVYYGTTPPSFEDIAAVTRQQ